MQGYTRVKAIGTVMSKPLAFPDPTRSIASYAAMLKVGGGVTGVLSNAAAQSEQACEPKLRRLGDRVLYRHGLLTLRWSSNNRAVARWRRQFAARIIWEPKRRDGCGRDVFGGRSKFLHGVSIYCSAKIFLFFAGFGWRRRLTPLICGPSL